MLEVKNLNKSFGEKQVLKNVSFAAQRGKAFGFLGRNGAGKTTTIRIIMDIFKGDSGEVLIDGVKNTKTPLRFGYLPEERGLYPKINILEQMVYFGELRGLSGKEAKIRSLALLKKLEAEDYAKQQLSTLSKGNQQKIQLAIAILNDPDIVILDEPFSGLDPINAQILKRTVLELVAADKIVLFSSHQMSTVEEFCDSIAIINRSEIVLSGDLDEIKKQYPKDKILISAESGDHDTLLKNLQNSPAKDLLLSASSEKNGLTVQLKNESEKNNLLSYIINSGTQIDKFFVMEPTLEQIFVEKAGE